MPLMLDELREEYARHLFTAPEGRRFSADKALAHVLRLAFEAGITEAKVSRGDTAPARDEVGHE